jgi:hypothetical protein
LACAAMARSDFLGVDKTLYCDPGDAEDFDNAEEADFCACSGYFRCHHFDGARPIWRDIRSRQAATARRRVARCAIFWRRAGSFGSAEPNSVVGPIHPKAMPVILTTPDEVETWLTAPAAEALKLQRSLPGLFPSLDEARGSDHRKTR